MSGDETRIGVVSTTRRCTDNDADRFAGEWPSSLGCKRGKRREERCQEHEESAHGGLAQCTRVSRYHVNRLALQASEITIQKGLSFVDCVASASPNGTPCRPQRFGAGGILEAVHAEMGADVSRARSHCGCVRIYRYRRRLDRNREISLLPVHRHFRCDAHTWTEGPSRTRRTLISAGWTEKRHLKRWRFSLSAKRRISCAIRVRRQAE